MIHAMGTFLVFTLCGGKMKSRLYIKGEKWQIEIHDEDFE
jgi:hypothetical protein